jgi:hypothetical protein
MKEEMMEEEIREVEESEFDCDCECECECCCNMAFDVCAWCDEEDCTGCGEFEFELEDDNE